MARLKGLNKVCEGTGISNSRKSLRLQGVIGAIRSSGRPWRASRGTKNPEAFVESCRRKPLHPFPPLDCLLMSLIGQLSSKPEGKGRG